MQVSILGCGYVGLVTGAGLASLGHDVLFIDIDKAKLDSVKKGKPPFFEPGLGELLQKAKAKASLSFSTDLKDAKGIVFICVPTPFNEKKNEFDVSIVKSTARALAGSLPKGSPVVIKSTVTPGTCDGLQAAFPNLSILSNPEFLREGSAVRDFLEPDRIVIGSDNPEAIARLKSLYSKVNSPVLVYPRKTSELVKMASNTYLALRLSFINELGALCKQLGIDVYDVAEGMGHDRRIGRAYFNSGCGYGGSCLPKDTKGLKAFAESSGVKMPILSAVIATNESQPERMLALLRREINPKGKTIGLLGLSFKPDTDDIRDAPSLKIMKLLLNEGARILAYDPKAMENTKRIYPPMPQTLEYAESAKEVLDSSDAILLLTEWAEFKSIRTAKPLIDGRNAIPKPNRGKNYFGLSW